MGIFRVRIRVFNLSAVARTQELELVVDTDATYSVIPREVAEGLGIQASQERTFTLADGRQVSRRIGWAGFAYDGREAASLVVIGEREALEELGFEVDPVGKALRPATQYLL
jgi:predicted aspartyl protease